MNSLIKKVMPVILVLLLMAAVFSGCNAPDAKAIAAPIHTPNQMMKNGNIQLLNAEDTSPETSEPESADPEAAEPGAETAPERFSLTDFLKDLLPRFLEFFDWWTAQVNKLFKLIEEV